MLLHYSDRTLLLPGHYNKWVVKLLKTFLSFPKKKMEEMLTVATEVPAVPVLLNDKYCYDCNDTRRTWLIKWVTDHKNAVNIYLQLYFRSAQQRCMGEHTQRQQAHIYTRVPAPGPDDAACVCHSDPTMLTWTLLEYLLSWNRGNWSKPSSFKEVEKFPLITRLLGSSLTVPPLQGRPLLFVERKM